MRCTCGLAHVRQCSAPAVRPLRRVALRSFLPLTHVAAYMCDFVIPLVFGCCVSFPLTATASAGDALLDFVRTIRPTLFLGVPQIWETVAEQIRGKVRTSSFWQRWLFDWAHRTGVSGNLAQQKGSQLPRSWWIARKLVFERIRAQLGLTRCRGAFTGGAPMPHETALFFLGLDVPLVDLYGFSECTGIAAIASFHDTRFNTCGRAPQAWEMRIRRPDALGNGEVTVRGRNVMLGYMHDAAATAAVFDADGFLCSGDLGRLDADGYLHITGRIKEIIVTLAGESVPPAPLGDAVRAALPFVQHAVLVGDQRPYLVCLLTVPCVLRSDGSSTEELAQSTVEALHCLGVSQARTVADLQRSPAFREIVERGLLQARAGFAAHTPAVRKWVLLPRQFTVTDGELGPTMKLRRRAVLSAFRDIIDYHYAHDV